MREIKFRGSEKESNKWVFGYARHWKCCYGDEWHIQGENDNVHIVIPETVGQFTGLKDHKGREIYEGDIVEILPQFSAKQGLKRKFHLFAVVRWDERLARFVVISKEILDSIPDSECVSVIGNVHDTPELLTLGGFEK